MEFHISRSVREKLDLKDLLFNYVGNVIFANVPASRKLAQQMNAARGAESDPSRTVHAGELFAMGLIDELSHAMVARYRQTVDPTVLDGAMRWLGSRIGAAEVDRLLLAFTEQFPNTAVFSGSVTASEWLAGSTDGMPNRDAELEELLLLWLANANPAFAPFRELFEDTRLQQATQYKSATDSLPAYFDTRPPLDPKMGTLLTALMAPMRAAPDSITGQLNFIREHWAPYLGDNIKQILLALDTIQEEDVARWLRFHPHGDPFGHAHARDTHGFRGDEYIGFDEQFGRRRRYARDHQAPLDEYEAFSPDYDWMPNVVLMAKSTYVWLEQLSKKYGRHIHRLDHIPEEELRLLAERGMTGLWLIGLWERSTASKTIKNLRGQWDAVASAYSLKRYDIAEDLGGNQAYRTLRERAQHYGLRLASDMVPNHMGIDSDWVIEHPDWFIQRWESPFPAYSFNGPDLSTDSRVEIKIEDHYYEQTDAAVVFRLRHHGENTTRYVYHGNDGTSFAWNDTAQLDYSKAFVREQVIQIIFHVARLFPIIRFDAAMTLAKRHVQRLWFPLPGVGGSIPSRSESALSQEEFDALMPNEFWREVVDRVAVEVPGTLLLAEAFWLLEGYFVRTLGMHRVYNSAFMNMMRDEENAKYRSYLKKTIELDPDILGRYVNFMSNPDERTAIDQFGDGDKYFGTATLLATLPGLPMFAHGQVEGFTERYGMEFKQGRQNETPNEGLIARHQKEIAPLLRNRHVFASSANFTLYDFWTEHGSVDENVFAYSNRSGDQSALVLYNNVYGSTRGTIHISAAFMNKGAGQLRQRSLMDGLGLPGDDSFVIAYRDTLRNLEYLRRASDLANHGLTVNLNGFGYVVLQGWRALRSTTAYPWDRLCDFLHGEGVSSLDYALTKLRLMPLGETLREMLKWGNLGAFQSAADDLRSDNGGTSDAESRGKNSRSRTVKSPEAKTKKTSKSVRKGSEQLNAQMTHEPVASNSEKGPEANQHIEAFLNARATLLARMRELTPNTQFAEPDPENSAESLARAALQLPVLRSRQPASPWLPGPDSNQRTWAPVIAYVALRSLLQEQDRLAVFDQLGLRTALAESFHAVGFEGEDGWRAAALVRILMPAEQGLQRVANPDFWTDPDVRWLAGVNESQGETFVNKEAFEELLDWLILPDLLASASVSKQKPGLPATLDREAKAARQKMEEGGYKIGRFLSAPAKTARRKAVKTT